MSSGEGGAAEGLSLWPPALGPHPVGLTVTESSEELANQKWSQGARKLCSKLNVMRRGQKQDWACSRVELEAASFFFFFNHHHWGETDMSLLIHPQFTSQPSGDETWRVAVQMLPLSGTKRISCLARRWVYLSAAPRASASSRWFYWQKPGTWEEAFMGHLNQGMGLHGKRASPGDHLSLGSRCGESAGRRADRPPGKTSSTFGFCWDPAWVVEVLVC